MHPSSLKQAAYKVVKAFEKGIVPERSNQAYILKDKRLKPIAIFKLTHALEEYAAFRLDHGRFAHVSPTMLTGLEHPIWGGKKTGSFQLYIQESALAIDVIRLVNGLFSSSCIRRIATLDIRLMNIDRHASNLLVVREKEVIPIDHGLILQNGLCGNCFIWARWKEAKTPFSSEERRYIAALNPEQERQILLNELQFGEKISNRSFVATVLLQEGAARNLSASQIGNMMVRPANELSGFEKLIGRLEKNQTEWTFFTRCVYEEVEKILEGGSS